MNYAISDFNNSIDNNEFFKITINLIKKIPVPYGVNNKNATVYNEYGFNMDSVNTYTTDNSRLVSLNDAIRDLSVSPIVLEMCNLSRTKGYDMIKDIFYDRELISISKIRLLVPDNLIDIFFNDTTYKRIELIANDHMSIIIMSINDLIKSLMTSDELFLVPLIDKIKEDEYFNINGKNIYNSYSLFTNLAGTSKFVNKKFDKNDLDMEDEEFNEETNSKYYSNVDEVIE